jgi:predicted RNA-binding protein
MCQATVYLKQDGQEKQIMRDVILLEPVENGVRLATFFEEPRLVRGRVLYIDFLKHCVWLEPLAKEEDDGGN